MSSLPIPPVPPPSHLKRTFTSAMTLRTDYFNGPCVNSRCRDGGNRDERPQWADPVAITFEKIDHVRGPIVRAVQLVAIVVPGSTVELRKGVATPNSISGHSTLGYPDKDKGHILSLDLGGPNIRHNIIPQWAGQQRSGSWRQAEVRIGDAALTAMEKDKTDLTTVVIQIQYLLFDRLETANRDRLTFPRSIKVITRRRNKADVVEFDEELNQNTLDEERLLKLEMQEEEWDEVGNTVWDDVTVTEDGKGKKRFKIETNLTPAVYYPIRSNAPHARVCSQSLINMRSTRALRSNGPLSAALRKSMLSRKK